MQTIVHCCCFCQKLNGRTDSSLHPLQVAHADILILNRWLTKNVGGFMLADISFKDMFASSGAFNSGSVVVCETFASPDVFASGGAFNSVSVVV